MHQRVRVVVRCVCVWYLSVCLVSIRLSGIYHIFSDIVHLYVTTMIAGIYGADFYKYYKNKKKLHSHVMAYLTYCNIHWCYCSEPLLDSLMTQLSALLKKASDR